MNNKQHNSPRKSAFLLELNHKINFYCVSKKKKFLNLSRMMLIGACLEVAALAQILKFWDFVSPENLKIVLSMDKKSSSPEGGFAIEL